MLATILERYVAPLTTLTSTPRILLISIFRTVPQKNMRTSCSQRRLTFIQWETYSICF
jgi:hypothetical protein